jgi:hypothetical protein
MFLESIAAIAFIPCIVLSGSDSELIKVRADHQLGYTTLGFVQKIVNQNCPTLNVSVTSNSCKILKSGDPTTKACFLESTVGNFFVSQDMVGNTNIVYTRLD